MDDDAQSSPAGRLVRDMIIVNKKGLHARASAHFVRCAEAFDAEIDVSKDQSTVGGTSIMGLMMLSAGPGSTIHVGATGPDAAAALDALSALVAGRFGEEE
jgi:phosphocarrier protein